jgi:hypothetical protein
MKTLTVLVTDELLDFLKAKALKLQKGQPYGRRDKITPETLLAGYAELGRQHDKLVADVLRERQVTKTA